MVKQGPLKPSEVGSIPTPVAKEVSMDFYGGPKRFGSGDGKIYDVDIFMVGGWGQPEPFQLVISRLSGGALKLRYRSAEDAKEELRNITKLFDLQPLKED